MKRYYYLVINENINSGLLKSQVTDVIKNQNISLINVHKFHIKNRTYQNSINIPLAIPYKLFMFNIFFFMTPIFAFIYALILLPIVKKNSIVISRSYFPSLVMLILSKLKNVDYIFDTRSLFIDESTLNGTIKENGLNYKMWKYLEKKILCSSSKTTAVSLKQKEYYELICPTVLVELIPCYVSPVEIISEGKKLELRKKIGFNNDDIVIAYFGSMDNGWNNIDMYASFFKECKNFGYKILLISQNYNSLKLDNRLSSEHITILNTNNKSSKELQEYLQIADYGVVLMKKAADWETRLSVKFVEYLNVGLKVIVGEYVGEAARYAKDVFKNDTVIYYDKNSIESLTKNSEKYDNSKTEEIFGLHNFQKLVD